MHYAHKESSETCTMTKSNNNNKKLKVITIRAYRWLRGKGAAYNTGESSSIPGTGRPPGGGNGNPLQYSCLQKLKDRGAWGPTVHGVAKIQTQLSD